MGRVGGTRTEKVGERRALKEKATETKAPIGFHCPIERIDVAFEISRADTFVFPNARPSALDLKKRGFLQRYSALGILRERVHIFSTSNC